MSPWMKTCSTMDGLQLMYWRLSGNMRIIEVCCRWSWWYSGCRPRRLDGFVLSTGDDGGPRSGLSFQVCLAKTPSYVANDAKTILAIPIGYCRYYIMGQPFLQEVEVESQTSSLRYFAQGTERVFTALLPKEDGRCFCVQKSYAGSCWEMNGCMEKIWYVLSNTQFT